MKTWNILSQYTDGSVIEQLLQNREIEDIDEFLNTPSLNHYVSKLSKELKVGLKEAKKLIEQEIISGTPIVVYGDYDVDGISATALLVSCLRNEKHHEKTYYFIPNRFEHGYGLSQEGIDAALSRHNLQDSENVLWITVDTGVTGGEEISYMKSLGHRVILTDHHQKPKDIPDADILVWSDEVVGAGISWMLTKVLGSKNKRSLALAALATVTDLQPLRGFNRALVKYGLEVMRKAPPVGIDELLKVSGKKKKEISTYELGWVLGPRINALGRLGDASDAVELLLSQDSSAAAKIATTLNDINIKRQNKTLEMYDLAADLDRNNLPHVIFSSHDDYHEGIIGLVAARLVQQYYRPSIVISTSDGFGKGSVRSVTGVNIIEALREFEHLFEDIGGHPMAAGFTIKRENIEVLQEKMTSYAYENFSGELFVPSLTIDMQIPANVINMGLLEELEKLKPYGVGNREPLFMTENLGVVGVDWVGREATHLLLKLYDGTEYRKAIFFSAKKVPGLQVPEIGDSVAIACSIRKNEFRGKVSVDLIVKDLRL
jgi:single-stranded-DNA-specific exonuclease